MSEAEANITVHQAGNVSVVELADRKILDEPVINEIGERLRELAATGPSPRLLIDFKNVEHLSSAALGVLITLNRQVGDQQGQLVLANIHPQIYEVFKITRLNRLFNIQSTTEEALRVFH